MGSELEDVPSGSEAFKVPIRTGTAIVLTRILNISGNSMIASGLCRCVFAKELRMIPVLPQARPWLMILQIMLSALVSISTATSTVNLATFTPLEDGTGSSSAFFAIPTSQSASPGDCIDSCVNNATGSGNQGGCGGWILFHPHGGVEG